MRIASRQHVNLWGRSYGEVDDQIHLSVVPESNPAVAMLEFDHGSRIDELPGHSNVTLIMIYNLVVEKIELGRIDQFLLPEGQTEVKHGISLRKFGSNFGRATWQVKITEPEEPGRVYAWTKKKVINQGEGAIGDGTGGYILRIKKEEMPDEKSWTVEFPPGECPFVVVNENNPSFYEELKNSSSLSSSLLIPEAVGLVIDELITQILEGDYELGTDQSTWQYKWMKWLEEEIRVSKPDEMESPTDLADWIKWKNDNVRRIRSYIGQSSKVEQRIGG